MPLSRKRATLLASLLCLTSISLLSIHRSTRSHLIDISSHLPYPYYTTSSLSPPLNGLVTVLKDGGRTHPILQLIEKGKQRVLEKEKRRLKVRSLRDAVEDYREAFGMDPPEGFDAWYQLVRELNSTTTPSLIPLAHTSVLPFLALPAGVLRARVKGIYHLQAMCGMKIRPEESGVKGLSPEEELEGMEREQEKVQLLHLDFHSEHRVTPFQWQSMIQTDVDRFPASQDPSEPLQLALWTDDASFRMTDVDVLEISRKLARAGKVWDMDELEELEKASESKLGWNGTCILGDKFENAEKKIGEKRFIYDLEESTDYCKHPSLLGLNGELMMRQELPMRPLLPVMAISRPLHGSDMLGPPSQSTMDIVETPIPWENKTDSRMVWRGHNSGIYHLNRWDWRSSQRDRLDFLANDHSEQMVEVLVDVVDSTGVEVELWSRDELAKKYLDVGLIGGNRNWHCGIAGPIRFVCNIDEKHILPNCPGDSKGCDEMEKEHGWVEEITWEEAQRYKIVLDVDGYGWSSRWRKELSSGSMLLKSTIYNEWWSEQAVPWYHYIPVQYDYSDIFDVMAFFTGSPVNQSGENGRLRERDELARKIGEQGRQFALDHLRLEDMRSYLFLVLLEYRRAWSDDRLAATFTYELST